MIIEYNGKTYSIPKINFEADNIYLFRLWYVAKKQPNDITSLEKAIHESIILKNIKFLGCKYLTNR